MKIGYKYSVFLKMSVFFRVEFCAYIYIYIYIYLFIYLFYTFSVLQNNVANFLII